MNTPAFGAPQSLQPWFPIIGAFFNSPCRDGLGDAHLPDRILPGRTGTGIIGIGLGPEGGQGGRHRLDIHRSFRPADQRDQAEGAGAHQGLAAVEVFRRCLGRGLLPVPHVVADQDDQAEPGDGGEHDGNTPQHEEACLRVKPAGTQGEMQGVFHHEQDHRRRQGCLPPGQQRQRQTDVAGVIEQHRRHQGFCRHTAQAGKWPGQQPTAHQQQERAQGKRRIGRQIKGLARHGGKDQGGHEHIHVQAVGHRHFRLVPTAVEITGSNNPENWKEDRQQAQRQAIVSHVAYPSRYAAMA